MNKESVDKAARKRLQDKESEKEKQALWVQAKWCRTILWIIGSQNWFFMLRLFLCLIYLHFRNQKEQESGVEEKPAEQLANLETVVEETEGTVCLHEAA